MREFRGGVGGRWGDGLCVEGVYPCGSSVVASGDVGEVGRVQGGCIVVLLVILRVVLVFVVLIALVGGLGCVLVVLMSMVLVMEVFWWC